MDTAVADWAARAARLPVAFAQVREDADLDRHLVERLPAGCRVALVASGGCTAALLATLPTVGRLHLVDPNPAQLALARLKLALLRAPAATRLAALGHEPMPAEERAEVLARFGLPAGALGPSELVAGLGPDHAGRYELLFAELRSELADVAAELGELLRLAGPAEQARRADPTTPLGGRLDAAFDRVMALPNLVALFGEGATRNPAEPFSRHFARRTRHALATLPAADNPYLWQLLAGRYPPGRPAPWFDAPATDRLPAVTTRHALMDDALADEPGAFDLVHLSNVLDWLSPDEARQTSERAAAALRPGGLVFVRQLNSSLDVPALGGPFEWLPGAAELHRRDRSFFYRSLHLGRKR